MNRKLIIALLSGCLLLPSASLAAPHIGRVIYASGETLAENNGETRPLRRGSLIRQGDNLITRGHSRSQIRMSDGALFALRPNTRMSFENYRYDAQSRKGSSVLSLIKGGFRTITGLIGRFSKQDYRVRTSVATIGVRGTHFGLTLCQQNDCVDNGQDKDLQDGLYGSVVDGEIVAQNEAGEFSFSNDEYFHVDNASSRPRTLLKPPGIIFDQAKFVRGKQATREQVRERLKQTAAVLRNIEQKQDYIRNRIEQAVFEADKDAGNNINLVKAPAGSAVSFSFFNLGQGGTLAGNTGVLTDDGTTQRKIILNAANDNVLPVLIEQSPANTTLPTRTLAIAGANAIDLGSMDIGNTGVRAAWGRWGRNYVAAINSVPLPTVGPLHFAYASDTTTSAELSALQTASLIATYSSVGGTRPTDLAGNIAGSYADVQIQADFGANSIDYAVATSVGGELYSASATGASLANAVNDGIALDDTFFTGNTNPITGQPNTGFGNASLSFVGANAEGAISSFFIEHNTATVPSPTAAETLPNHVNGAVILIQESAALPPPANEPPPQN